MWTDVDRASRLAGDCSETASTTSPFTTSWSERIGRTLSASASTATVPGPGRRTVSPIPFPSTDSRRIGPPLRNVRAGTQAAAHASS